MGTTQALNITSGILSQGASYNLTAGAITIASSGTLLNKGTGDLTLGGTLTNSGLVSLGAGDCGGTDDILIRSSVNGTQRSWNGTGTFRLYDVDIKDMAGSASVTAYTATNTGNNGANWTFDSATTPAVVQTPVSATANSTTVSKAYGSALTPGTLLIALVISGNVAGNTLTSVVDGANTWTIDVGPISGASYYPYRYYVASRQNSGTSTPTVTATWASSAALAITLFEVSGAAVSNAFDTSASAINTSNNARDFGAITLAQANEFIVAIQSGLSTATAANGYVIASQTNVWSYDGTAYLIATSTTPAHAFTTAGSGDAVASLVFGAGYKGAISTCPAVPPAATLPTGTFTIPTGIINIR